MHAAWMWVSVLLCLITTRRNSVGANEISYYPVKGALTLKDRSALLATTEVVLNGGEYRTYTRSDGTFTFHDVKPGIYLLDVLSVDYFFSQVKLNLPRSLDQSIQCLEYRYPGAQKQAIDHPLRLVAAAKKKYFEEREKVGLHILFRNPMMLMLAFTGLIVVIMPKLMENMDPEEMKKMQEQMGAANDPAQMIKNLFGVSDDTDNDNDPSKQIGDS